MSPYLTVVSLRRDARSLARDAQQWHGIVRRCTATSGDRDRVLWALPSPDQLVVQSPELLDEQRWAGLAAHVRSVPLQFGWRAGDDVVLSLIANPTRSVFTRGARGKRVSLPLSEVEAWVRRKLADAVSCDAIQVQDMGSRSGRRGDGRVTHRLVGVAAEGAVLDPEALSGLVRDGVGSGKSYGAGLLIVGAR